MQDVINLKSETGFSTIGVTDDGTSSGLFLGLVTGRDYRPSRDPRDKKVSVYRMNFLEQTKKNPKLISHVRLKVRWELTVCLVRRTRTL